ncbi:MAG TPA: TonB-dependent receptor [Cytophagales bacterium]|nr:TonB-dependent receptor [Cytophagales bacterium]
MKKHQTIRSLIVMFMRFALLPLALVLITSSAFTASFARLDQLTVLDKVITISAEGDKIKNILPILEKTAKIKFSYNPKTIALDEKVSFSYIDKKLGEVLDGIFEPLSISYYLSGDYIILVKRTENSTGSLETSSDLFEEIKVTGTVVSNAGAPLPGVNVFVKGTTIGTTTDAEGKYSLVASKNSTLVFSFIGYKTFEVELINQTVIDVKLEEDAATLEEVVVVAYGTQKEYTVAGAITTIAPTELQKGTSRSLSNNLAGHVAGIIAVQRSGEPGYDKSNFWIRGISTFQGARDPLILVDGVERSLENIDPAEIESFSVLKDASASAVYGVRGANGVILINTKRGKVGKPSISLRYEQGFTQPVKLPQFLGAADYLEVLNSISTESGQTPIYTEERINNTRNKVDPDLYPDVDWLDEITKEQATNSRLNLSASGGSDFLRYSVVASHYAEQGIIERDPGNSWDSSLKLKRYNIRSNVDLNITPSTLLRVNIGGYLQEDNRPTQSIDALFGWAFETPPFVHPTQYSSGEIPVVPERKNPWALATQTGFQRNSGSKLESLFSLEQKLDKIVPGLTGRFKFAFDRYSQTGVKRGKEPDFYNPAVGRNEDGTLNLVVYKYGQEFLGYEKTSEWGDKSVYVEGNFGYSRNFGNHYIDGLLLYNQRSYDNGDRLPYRNQGLAARVSYSFDRRYIAEANFGYNGSENFAKGRRFGFFPSIALGWIVSEENFMSNYKNTFSKIKLRGSYGLVGNDKIDGRRFAYLTTIGDTDGYRWGINNDYHRAGKREGDYGIQNLTWETVTKSNVGIELGLWNSIALQVDFFKEQRKDIFIRRETIPSSSGFINPPWANYGAVDNKGVDASMSISRQLTKDFYISSQATFTYAQNQIIEQDEPLSVIGTNRSRTGKPVGQIFGLIAEGLFTEEDFQNPETGELVETLPKHDLGSAVRPGDIKYKDVNGDGVVNELDRTAIGGTVDPQIVYGFGVNMKFKSIDLGFFFQGNAKTYRTIGRSDGVNYFIPGSGNGALGNIYSNANDRWTVENPRQDVFWPRLSDANHISNNSQESTWWLKDMSMLRMKHIELGYSLPEKLINRVYLKNARIFVTGNNLLTLSSFKLWDPELDTKTGFRYPIMKSVSIGMNLDF